LGEKAMKRLGLALVLLCLTAVPLAAQIPDEFTNLELFPKDIGKRDLVSAMRQFASSLGVRCNHCHVGPDNLQGMDFATDELETKRVARSMMQMTDAINSNLLPASGRDPLLRVGCVTCHRGITRPEDLGDILSAAVEEGGVDDAVARYRELRDEHYGSGAYDFSAGTLNGLAETLAREKQDMDGAIKTLELNVEFNPEAAYSFMMLGQLQLMKGDKDSAVASLERALELEPENERAKTMLERAKAAE
jgi:tetratricopeptide (TPR) repeat protein